MTRSVLAAAAALVLALAGCSGAEDGAVPASSASTGSAATGSASTGAPSAEPTGDSATAEDPASAAESTSPDDAGDGSTWPVVTTTGSAFGTVLVDGRRQAIYLFDRETGRTPRCYGACAAAWPPVLADALPQARRQVRAGLLGTVQRRGGARQVTYGGHPLYFYAHEGPGQLLCHDVVEYGGRWLAVTPRGVAAPT